MKNDAGLVGKLDEVIFKHGSEMGPALTNLILYGPVDRRLISRESLDILKHTSASFEGIYNEQIFPKIGEMFSVIAQGDYSIPKNKEGLACSFEYRSPEEIRERFKISYGGQFDLDDVTKNSLFGNGEYCRHGKNVKHCFNDESGHMLNTRYKDTEEIVPKYMTTYNRLNEVRRANFLNFLIDVAENDPHSWEKHDYYRRIHGVGSMNMLLGDFFGVKITDMNQERAEKNMKRLKKMHDAGISINFNGFSSINKRFRDNRWRVPLLRPGGIHHTLIDSEFPNYPVEVMFRGIKDETLNLYGPHRHDIYTANGKKDNPIYCGRG